MFINVALIILLIWLGIVSFGLVYLLGENESRYRDMLKQDNRIDHCENVIEDFRWVLNDYGKRLNRFEDDGK